MMKIKTLIPHCCLVVAIALLTGCGPMDDGELQRQEQAVFDPCLCIPGSLNCPPPGCLPLPEPPPFCGDGILSPVEECDKTALGGETCASLGYGGGTLSCKADCTFDTSKCDPCGNGALDPGEACDSSNLAGKTCVSLGFAGGGTLKCSSSCTFDTSGCKTICGDGLVQGTEQCDGTAQTLPTCQSKGYQGGTVSCSATCEYDWSNCVQVYSATEGVVFETTSGFYSTDLPGPWCGPGLMSGGKGFFCDRGDLCDDPYCMRCSRYVSKAAGQIYTAGSCGSGPLCGNAPNVPNLAACCEIGDVCTDSSRRWCTRQ